VSGVIVGSCGILVRKLTRFIADSELAKDGISREMIRLYSFGVPRLRGNQLSGIVSRISQVVLIHEEDLVEAETFGHFQWARGVMESSGMESVRTEAGSATADRGARVDYLIRCVDWGYRKRLNDVLHVNGGFVDRVGITLVEGPFA
jgi:hypothetical protein